MNAIILLVGSIFFAIFSYFSWGTGVFFEAITARRISPYSFLFWSLAISFILGSFYAPFAISDFTGYTPQLLTLNLILGFFGLLVGILIYYEALKEENRVLVGTIASSFPVVIVILSTLFLGEKLSVLQNISIFVIFIGLFLSIFNFNEIRNNRFVISRGLIFAVIVMFLWGIYFTFVKVLVNNVGWFWPNYITFALFPLAFLYLIIKGQKLQKPTVNKVFFPLVISTVLLRLAEFSYNLGISKGSVAIVAAISGANPTLFVIFAFLFFKDPIKKQQIAGIIVTLIGIVLVSFFSV